MWNCLSQVSSSVLSAELDKVGKPVSTTCAHYTTASEITLLHFSFECPALAKVYFEEFRGINRCY